MVGNVNPNMIVLARESRGWNQGELAEKIGMSPTNLSKIERNDIGIQKEVLETIADQTNFPLQFFYQPGTILPENLSYRKRETVAQKLITPINAQINIIRKHIQFLTTVLNIHTPALPNVEVTEKQTPEKIAIKLRQLWNIESVIIDDLTRILEDHGIVINTFDFRTERVDSRSILTDEKLPIIFFNKVLLGDRQRFTLAYELGQLIMHTFNVVPSDRDISHEANAFAAEFLMPAKYIKEDFKNGVTIPILGELKRKWKVSMIALLYRADDLGFITPNQKRYLIQQFNQLKIRRREPIELDIPTEQPKLVKRWIADYRAKTKLGVVEMAALLCLNVDEFLELYS
jgi:Zn-dependent peptidase ImmA (M78 family)/DNA-binding Xre family transcriptional regulator